MLRALKITEVSAVAILFYVLKVRWFKYDRDWFGLFTHKSVPVIFEPPCITEVSTVAFLCYVLWRLEKCLR